MTRAGLVPAWSATSLMPVSQRPFSAITCTAALRICWRRASESLRRGLMPAPEESSSWCSMAVRACRSLAPHLRLNVQSGTASGHSGGGMSAWDAIVIRGRPQRAGGRRLPGPGRGPHGGPGGQVQDRGRGRHRRPWPEAPGIKVTRLSYVMSLMPPGIIRDLDLERHGYKLYPMGPAYQAWPDSRSLTLYDDDARRNAEQLARFSKKDAEAMPRWDAWLEGLAAVLGPLLTRTRPRSAPGGPRTWPTCSAWPGATGALTCAPSAT